MGASRPLLAIESDETYAGQTPMHLRPAALDIFLAWLLWLPQDRDIAAAAALEIRKIDRSATSDTTVLHLRQMLVEAAGSGRLH